MKNTSVGIIGPKGELEKYAAEDGSFRILEGEPVQPYLSTMQPKEVPEGAGSAGGNSAAPAPTAPPAVPGGVVDEDVQMQE